MATEVGLKSRMRENRTYGSVRGSRQAFHVLLNTLKGVSSLSTRLRDMQKRTEAEWMKLAGEIKLWAC